MTAAPADFANKTPAELGFYMPAEWRAHAATWLTWPKDPETWPGRVPQVENIFLQMMAALAPHETVNLLVDDEETEHSVRARCTFAGAQNVRCHCIVTVDSWIRDYGPNFLVSDKMSDKLQFVAGASRASPAKASDKLRFVGHSVGPGLAFNDWIFNGWGGKYKSYEEDESIARAIAETLKIPVFDHKFILEGGSIEVNGAGTCMTTEQCLLNNNRNPHLSRAEIEEFLKGALGVSHLIWLGEGIAGDDTDGHIDDIARFVNPTTVVCIVEANSKDENYRYLQENYERLQCATDQNGEKLSIVKLPCPQPVYYDGARLPASYANFYVANGVVLVPILNDPNDAEVLGVLGELFAERKVVGLRCNEVVAGLGAIHCVTQQEPAPFSS